MITLFTFGPAFGLPDPSPFVMKAQTLLKIAGIDFQTNTKGLRRAPKGKLPYLRDGDKIVADSTQIRLHIEKAYGIDFERDLDDAQRGVAWAAEKMCEDHLYWLMVEARWCDDSNFKRGPSQFFNMLPAPARPLAKLVVRRQIRRTLHGQGTGRYSGAERALLAQRAFASLSAILGDKPYFMGDEPCGADATVFAFVAGALCPLFEADIRVAAETHSNLRSYRDRMMHRYFPSG